MLSATWFVLGGMAITFGTLAILMVVMTALNWLLASRPGAKGPPAGTGRA